MTLFDGVLLFWVVASFCDVLLFKVVESAGEALVLLVVPIFCDVSLFLVVTSFGEVLIY